MKHANETLSQSHSTYAGQHRTDSPSRAAPSGPQPVDVVQQCVDPPQPEPAAPQFDHVAQQVPDVAAAVEWYRRTLSECRVLYQDPTWALVETDGLRLAFIRQGDHPDHVGFRVTASELERLATLHGRTIRPHRDGSRSFYLDAPGGRWIEFITYPP